MEKKTKKTSNYISIKESRAIIKYNIKQMKYYENLKRQKRDESEYITSMKDPNNIIEIDNLKTCFLLIMERLCRLMVFPFPFLKIKL